MRDLMMYLDDCKIMLDEIGIPYGDITSCKVNTRARSRWGICKPVGYGSFEIEISDMLLDDNAEEDGLINTIIHELLHTVPGCLNHGQKWKEMARRVYNAYGIEIKRASSAEEKGVAPIEQVKVYKYFLRCPDCGYVFKYMRMTSAVKNPGGYTHRGCRHSLERIYEI